MLKAVRFFLVFAPLALTPMSLAKDNDQTPAVYQAMGEMAALLKAKKPEEFMKGYVDPKMVAQIRAIKRYDQTIELWKGAAGDVMTKNLTSCQSKPLIFSDAGKTATCSLDVANSMVFHLVSGTWRWGN